MRRFLARNGPSEFAAIHAGVQPAERFAVRSALNKGRSRGEFSFSGDKYGLETKKPPAAAKATGGKS